ncbi:hypothetical protein VPH35_026456 [Triticum aestivum]
MLRHPCPRGWPARRAPGLPRGQHGDGGGPAKLSEHGEPLRGRARPHRLQRHRLGALDPRLVRRREPPRRLNRYLYLSGRVDMRQVERTVHNLIRSGMVLKAARSPYHGFIYVAFQERATFISHGNTARRAKEHGDVALARICGAIAADEKRHELAYTRIVAKLFEIDPDGAVRALAYMMRRRIVMPASLMTDGHDGHLFTHYGAVAHQAGIYTASDYRGILEHLIKQWGVEELVAAGLSDEGRRARDYVCALPHKIRRLEEKAHERGRHKAQPTTSIPFSWIFDRPIKITVA